MNSHLNFATINAERADWGMMDKNRNVIEPETEEEQFKFSLWTMMLCLTGIATFLATPHMKNGPSFWVLVCIAGWFYFDWSNWKTHCLVLLMLFSPFYWLAGLEFRVPELDWHWLKMTPIFPGYLLLSQGIGSPYGLQYPDISTRGVAAAGVIAMLSMGMAVGRSGFFRWRFFLVLLALLWLAIKSSSVAYVGYMA